MYIDDATSPYLRICMYKRKQSIGYRPAQHRSSKRKKSIYLHKRDTRQIPSRLGA